MAITTQNITDLIEKAIELCGVSDEDAIELVIQILTLLLNYFGAEDLAEEILEDLGNLANDLYEKAQTLVKSIVEDDLTAEERFALVEEAKEALAELTAKLAETE